MYSIYGQTKYENLPTFYMYMLWAKENIFHNNVFLIERCSYRERASNNKTQSTGNDDAAGLNKSYGIEISEIQKKSKCQLFL